MPLLSCLEWLAARKKISSPTPPKTINSINSIGSSRRERRSGVRKRARALSRAFHLRRRWSKQAFVGIKTRRPATIDEN